MMAVRSVTSSQLWRGFYNHNIGIRTLQTLGTNNSASSAANSKKAKAASPLGLLRKKTGYSLSLCKKALAENDEDVDRAQRWLKEQAQAQGWNKANKLEGRNTTQGLIGVLVEGSTASMAELNCETDFVAKNKQFHSLLHHVVHSNLKASKEQQALKLDTLQLGKLPYEDKTLADLVALNIGQIGENITLGKAVSFVANEPNAHVIGLTHPSANIHSQGLHCGRYGVLMTFTKDPKVGTIPEGQTLASMARQLCQHIIGMNPSSVGNLDDPSTWPKEGAQKKVDKVEAVVEPEKKSEDEEENPYGDYAVLEDTSLVDLSQAEMIHQPFLLDTEVLVRDLLFETGIKIKDFARFEVGLDK